MKTVSMSLCLVSLAGMTLARAALAIEPPSPDVITCWYNENQVLTGSSPAPSGAAAGVKTQHAGSGERAWSVTVEGRNAAACPAKLPISTISQE